MEEELVAFDHSGTAASSAAKISVWWDIENCAPPHGVNPSLISGNICKAFRSLGQAGRISISAYGDVVKLSPDVRAGLASTGIALHHVPPGMDASDRAILTDLAFWSQDNPAPASILLISGDADFSTILHRLRMRGFKIFLARPVGVVVADSLVDAASTMWYWSRLARGEIGGLTAPTHKRQCDQADAWKPKPKRRRNTGKAKPEGTREAEAPGVIGNDDDNHSTGRTTDGSATKKLSVDQLEVPADDNNSADRTTDASARTKKVSVNQLKQQLTSFLRKKTKSCGNGYSLGRLKDDFQKRYGYWLEPSDHGFLKFQSFVMAHLQDTNITCRKGMLRWAQV